MDKSRDNLIPLVIGVILIVIVLFYYKTDGFIGSIGSMPKIKDSSPSLFLNNWSKVTGQDFRLFDFIQKLRMNNETLAPPNQSTKTNTRQLFASKKLSPIIIVPGLGATKIFAKWNKTSSPNVKTVDDTGNFEKSDQWNCKQLQTEWVQLWGGPSNPKELEGFCWSDNVKVHLSSDGNINNAEGVVTSTGEFGSLDFLSDMETLVETLKALGYVEGENLFGAGYDFRKISNYEDFQTYSMNMSKLIEKHCSLQGQQATIIGHDLGSVIANCFLVDAVPEWKKKYIKSFVSISGTFGGTPKALKTILEPTNIAHNFAGLSLMLPSPNVYGDNSLVNFNQNNYTSYDIPKLLDPEAAKIYSLNSGMRNKSMMAPGVPVYIMCGDDLNTESSYHYKNSLQDTPEKNFPVYQVDLPVSQKFHYPDYFIGDGTMPRFALEYPIFWSKHQNEPVYFQFFTGAEHTKILSMLEPMRYLVSIII